MLYNRTVVPGRLRCQKCGFVLVRVSLYMASGTTGPDESSSEPCLNCGEPMLPVTWEQEAREAWKTAERLFEETRALWQPMTTAPKDGSAVLVLLEGSDIPHAARWLSGPEDPSATDITVRPGWHLTWDGSPVPAHDGPRYWMRCPDDPDGTAACRAVLEAGA